MSKEEMSLKDVYFSHIKPYISMMKNKISKEGAELPKSYEHIAIVAGIKNINKIRVLYTEDNIDSSYLEILSQYSSEFKLQHKTFHGLTLGYDILISKEASVWALVHELRHVAQCELFESLDECIQLYLRECIKFGYLRGPFERDAIDFVNGIKNDKSFIEEYFPIAKEA